MSANPEIKDYIDARMESMRSMLDGRLAAFEAAVDARLTALEARLLAEVAALRVEMYKNTADLIKWMVGIFIATIAIFVSVLTLVVNHAVAGIAPPAQRPAPVIIQVPWPQGAPSNLTPPPTPPLK